MDGYPAAWAAWKVFGNSAHYKAVRHHQPLPKIPDGIELYILDFCYPFEVLVSVAGLVSKIVVLDHHISAQKDYEAYLNHSTIPNNLGHPSFSGLHFCYEDIVCRMHFMHH